MTIEVLVCRADGTQETETREVPDTYFDAPAAPEEPAETGE